MCQLCAIINAGIPRGVAASTSLKFGTGLEGEDEVNLAFPEELILFLRCVVFAARLRRFRIKPAGNVCQSRGQSDACLTRSRILCRSQYCLGFIVGTYGMS